MIYSCMNYAANINLNLFENYSLQVFYRVAGKTTFWSSRWRWWRPPCCWWGGRRRSWAGPWLSMFSFSIWKISHSRPPPTPPPLTCWGNSLRSMKVGNNCPGLSQEIFIEGFRTETFRWLRVVGNYPETLKAAYVINASIFFQLIFRVVQSSVQQKTLNKIKVFGSGNWEEVGWTPAGKVWFFLFRSKVCWVPE